MVIVSYMDGDMQEFLCDNCYYDSDCQMFIVIGGRVETKIPREFVKSIQIILK